MMHKSLISSLLIVLLLGCNSEESTVSDPSARATASLFTLKDLDGREYSLESARGKVVLLDFWATWCPPCKKEIPELIAIYDKYKEEDFLLWGIGLDKPASLESFSQKYAIPYPVLVGTSKVQSAYAVKAIPTVFIIDKLGRIGARFQGYREGAETRLEQEIRKLLNE